MQPSGSHRSLIARLDWDASGISKSLTFAQQKVNDGRTAVLNLDKQNNYKSEIHWDGKICYRTGTYSGTVQCFDGASYRSPHPQRC